MIVVVSADARVMSELATTQTQGFEVSPDVPAAIDLLNRKSPERSLLTTVVFSINELLAVAEAIGENDSLNYIVLFYADAGTTVAQILDWVSALSRNIVDDHVRGHEGSGSPDE